MFIKNTLLDYFMLEKILYSRYHDAGSSTTSASCELATDKMILRFLQLHGNRASPQKGASSLTITYFDTPTGLEKGVIMQDQIFLKGDYEVQSAERKLFVQQNQERVISSAVPTGIFIYNFDDKEDWEKRGKRNAMNANEKTKATLAEQINVVLGEFKDRFAPVLKRRVLRVAELYPIDPEKFFRDGYADGIGPVFDEQFWVVDDCFGGRGLEVSADTDRYHFAFDYHKGHPKVGTGRRLSISRGNFGFSVDFNETLSIAGIQEIGAPNISIDKYYHKNDFKTGTGRILYDNATRVWEEFRREVSIDDRIKTCNELTSEELSKAEPIVAYVKNHQ